MKKLIFILLAFYSLTPAIAQKGSVLVYGNFSVNSDNQDYQGFSVQNSQWFVNPGVGYQFSKRWTIGLQGSYGQGMSPYSTSSVDQTAVTNDWTAGIFLRYTRFFSKVFSVYCQLDVSNAGGTYDIKEGSTSITPQATYLGLKTAFYPALSINIHRGLCLNFNVGGIAYSSLNWTNHPSTLKTESNLNIDFGHSLTIGISKNFSKRMHGHHEMGEDTRHLNTKDDDDDAPKAKKEHKHHKKDKGARTKKSDEDDDD